jgi:hypothetical protein
MFQYRLSTLFLIFFFVAATMALCGPLGIWIVGIWIIGVLFLAAACLHRAKSLGNGIFLSGFLIFILVICPGLLPAISPAREAARRANCCINLKQLGLALIEYENEKTHFPPVYQCDANGKPLFSWMVSLLPFFDYGSVHEQLKKEEPWNSPQNQSALKQLIFASVACPSSNHTKKTGSTNYIAIIGPGTIWRKGGAVKLSELPNGGSHTVMLVEAADSDKHWAEPFALTVDEVLENMKTGRGVRISSGHPSGVHVLFANGKVDFLPAEMPLSLWRKILSGELSTKELDEIYSLIDPDAPDMVNVCVTPSISEPKPWIIILGVIVWLISIVLLFHRAMKSRKNPESGTVIPLIPSTS